MKTREGFVSNSSSSSFIMIGIKSEAEIDPFDKKIQAVEIGGETILGLKIAHALEEFEGFEEKNLWDSMMEAYDSLVEAGIKIDDPKEIKIFYGNDQDC